MLAISRSPNPSRGVHSAFTLAFCLLTSLLSAAAQQFEQIPSPTQGLYNSIFSWGDFNQDGKLDLLHGGLQIGDQLRVNLLLNTNNSFEPHVALPFGSYSGGVWVDFDGDGDLDIAPAGHNTLITGQRIYTLHRNDDASFTEIASEIDASGSPFWADIDRDGDLDLIFCGSSIAFNAPLGLEWRIFLNRPGKPWTLAHVIPIRHSSRDPIVTDWNNDGWPDLVHLSRDNADQWSIQVNASAPGLNFTRTELPLGSTDTPYLSVWGDYDNDGDLDLAFNGERWPTRVLKFVRNDGDSLASFVLQEAIGYALSWADLNGDGFLDLTTTDATPEGFSVLSYYQNLASSNAPYFSFATNLPFLGASRSTISMADFDGDGDADMAVAGLTNGVPGTRFFRNLINVSNPPPSMPTRLSILNFENGAVTLTWDPSTDPNQSGGLTYNLWIRRKDSTNFLLPPAADILSGRLHIPQRGNAGIVTNLVLTNLLAGTYEWSVQAVDNSYAASGFAPVSEFSIAPGLPRIEEFQLSDLRYKHATLAAEVIANGAETFLWFEYDTNSNFSLRTDPIAIGASHLPSISTVELTNLLTAQTYFARAVASNDLGIVSSITNSFTITNQLPSISASAYIEGLPGRISPPFFLTVGDVETPPENLQLSVEILNSPGSNPQLITLDDITIESDGTNRIVRIFSPEGEYGLSALRFTVTDEHGGTRIRNVSYVVAVFKRFSTLGTTFSDNTAVDVDSDGLLDLLNNFRWLRNTDGTNFVTAGSVVANFIAITPLALDDIDNDGSVDLAFGARVSSAPQMKIFTNSPGIPLLLYGFRQVTNDLSPDFQNAILSFADFDLDGDADFFASGMTNLSGTQNYTGVVWRNDGDKQFTPLREIFPRLYSAGWAWTDYNYDGAPDLFLLGTTNRQLITPYTELLLNDGAGNLTPSGITFPQYLSGVPYWGDFDSDGRADLLVAGRIGRTNSVILYQNTADGNFVEKTRFEPLIVRKCFVGDFDSDGSLDLLYEGSAAFGPFTETKLYLNRGGWNFVDASPMDTPIPGAIPVPSAIGDINRDGRLDIASTIIIVGGTSLATNSPPAAPGELSATLENSRVLLTWSAAQDTNQTNGLTYNVRVGRTPGGSEILSPLSRPDGLRLVTQPGNAHHSFKRILRNLSPGTYYWSVQAVDNSLDGGAFAPEQTFTISTAEPKITVITLDGPNLQLQLQAPATGSLIIEASSDLTVWTPIQTNTPPTPIITIESPIDQEASFYRAVLVQ